MTVPGGGLEDEVPEVPVLGVADSGRGGQVGDLHAVTARGTYFPPTQRRGTVLVGMS